MCGLTTVCAPIYVAETSSDQLRGRLGAAFQLLVTLGILYIDAFGLLRAWRWLGVSCIAASLAWSLLLVSVPESPAHLVRQRKYGDARKALRSGQTIEGKK